jgi:hypothetical protein
MPEPVAGTELNIWERMYSMYWGMSRKERFEAREALIPVSSSGNSSSSSLEVDLGLDVDVEEDLRRGSDDDIEELERRRSDEPALGRREFVTREERAGVI